MFWVVCADFADVVPPPPNSGDAYVLSFSAFNGNGLDKKGGMQKIQRISHAAADNGYVPISPSLHWLPQCFDSPQGRRA